MRPTFNQIVDYIRDNSGCSTHEIIAVFTDKGFEIDREWFWEEIAPRLIALGVENEETKRTLH